MNRLKCLPIIVFVCITMLVVSVCSAGKSTAAAKDPKKIVTAAFAKLNAVNNYHMMMENKYTLVYQGENFGLSVKSESDAQAKPLLVKNNMTFTMDSKWEKKEQKTVQYIEEDEGKIVAYSLLNDHWTRQVLAEFNPLAAYDDYFKAIKHVALLQETPEARDFEVVIESSYMSKEMARMMNALGMQKVQLPEGIFKNIGDLSYTVTIDKKTDAITQVNMDLSGILVNLGKNIVGSLNLPEEKKSVINEMLSTVKASASITFSQINQIENLQIPPEVKQSAITLPSLPALPTSDSDENTDSIKIGANLELTGSASQYANETLNGMRLAVKEANDEGGVLDRKIELVTSDNGSEVSGAANVMAAFVSEKKVAAVLGPVTNANMRAAAAIAEDSGLPIISSSATNPAITAENGQVKKYVFRSAFTDPYQGKMMSKFAAGKLGARTAAMLVDKTSDYSKYIAAIFKMTFTADGGTIVAEEGYLHKDRDFSEQLARIQQADPDVIFIPGYVDEVGPLIHQARDMSITAPLLGTDDWDSSRLVEYAGVEALNNTFFSNHYSTQLQSSVNQRFVAAYKKEFNSEPDVFSALGYEAATILIAAIKSADSSEPNMIRYALERTRLEGVTGPIYFNRYHNPIKSMVVIEMVNGEQVLLERVDP